MADFSPLCHGSPGTSNFCVTLTNNAGREVSPWHGVPFRAASGAFHVVCATPKGAWADCHVATQDRLEPLRHCLKETEASSGTSNGSADTWQVVELPRPSPWNCGIVPQTSAARRVSASEAGLPSPSAQNYFLSPETSSSRESGNSSACSWGAITRRASLPSTPATHAAPSAAACEGPVEVVEIGGGARAIGEVYAVEVVAAMGVQDRQSGHLLWTVVAVARDDAAAPLERRAGDCYQTGRMDGGEDRGEREGEAEGEAEGEEEGGGNEGGMGVDGGEWEDGWDGEGGEDGERSGERRRRRGAPLRVGRSDVEEHHRRRCCLLWRLTRRCRERRRWQVAIAVGGVNARASWRHDAHLCTTLACVPHRIALKWGVLRSWSFVPVCVFVSRPQRDDTSFIAPHGFQHSTSPLPTLLFSPLLIVSASLALPPSVNLLCFPLSFSRSVAAFQLPLSLPAFASPFRFPLPLLYSASRSARAATRAAPVAARGLLRNRPPARVRRAAGRARRLAEPLGGSARGETAECLRGRGRGGMGRRAERESRATGGAGGNTAEGAVRKKSWQGWTEDPRGELEAWPSVSSCLPLGGDAGGGGVGGGDVGGGGVGGGGVGGGDVGGGGVGGGGVGGGGGGSGSSSGVSMQASSADCANRYSPIPYSAPLPNSLLPHSCPFPNPSSLPSSLPLSSSLSSSISLPAASSCIKRAVFGSSLLAAWDSDEGEEGEKDEDEDVYESTAVAAARIRADSSSAHNQTALVRPGSKAGRRREAAEGPGGAAGPAEPAGLAREAEGRRNLRRAIMGRLKRTAHSWKEGFGGGRAGAEERDREREKVRSGRSGKKRGGSDDLSCVREGSAVEWSHAECSAVGGSLLRLRSHEIRSLDWGGESAGPKGQQLRDIEGGEVEDLEEREGVHGQRRSEDLGFGSVDSDEEGEEEEGELDEARRVRMEQQMRALLQEESGEQGGGTGRGAAAKWDAGAGREGGELRQEQECSTQMASLSSLKLGSSPQPVTVSADPAETSAGDPFSPAAAPSGRGTGAVVSPATFSPADDSAAPPNTSRLSPTSFSSAPAAAAATAAAAAAGTVGAATACETWGGGRCGGGAVCDPPLHANRHSHTCSSSSCSITASLSSSSSIGGNISSSNSSSMSNLSSKGSASQTHQQHHCHQQNQKQQQQQQQQQQRGMMHVRRSSDSSSNLFLRRLCRSTASTSPSPSPSSSASPIPASLTLSSSSTLPSSPTLSSSPTPSSSSPPPPRQLHPLRLPSVPRAFLAPGSSRPHSSHHRSSSARPSPHQSPRSARSAARFFPRGASVGSAAPSVLGTGSLHARESPSASPTSDQQVPAARGLIRPLLTSQPRSSSLHSSNGNSTSGSVYSSSSSNNSSRNDGSGNSGTSNGNSNRSSGGVWGGSRTPGPGRTVPSPRYLGPADAATPVPSAPTSTTSSSSPCSCLSPRSSLSPTRSKHGSRGEGSGTGGGKGVALHRHLRFPLRALRSLSPPGAAAASAAAASAAAPARTNAGPAASGAAELTTSGGSGGGEWLDSHAISTGATTGSEKESEMAGEKGSEKEQESASHAGSLSHCGSAAALKCFPPSTPSSNSPPPPTSSGPPPVHALPPTLPPTHPCARGVFHLSPSAPNTPPTTATAPALPSPPPSQTQQQQQQNHQQQKQAAPATAGAAAAGHRRQRSRWRKIELCAPRPALTAHHRASSTGDFTRLFSRGTRGEALEGGREGAWEGWRGSTACEGYEGWQRREGVIVGMCGDERVGGRVGVGEGDGGVLGGGDAAGCAWMGGGEWVDSGAAAAEVVVAAAAAACSVWYHTGQGHAHMQGQGVEEEQGQGKGRVGSDGLGRVSGSVVYGKGGDSHGAGAASATSADIAARGEVGNDLSLRWMGGDDAMRGDCNERDDCGGAHGVPGVCVLQMMHKGAWESEGEEEDEREEGEVEMELQEDEEEEDEEEEEEEEEGMDEVCGNHRSSKEGPTARGGQPYCHSPSRCHSSHSPPSHQPSASKQSHLHCVKPSNEPDTSIACVAAGEQNARGMTSHAGGLGAGDCHNHHHHHQRVRSFEFVGMVGPHKGRSIATTRTDAAAATAAAVTHLTSFA
ncbi:unnamed protein product [Closterium sp. NIES-53]